MFLQPLALSDDIEEKRLFLYAVMASIDGPFFGNFFPIIFALICYKTGYTVETGWYISQDPGVQWGFWISTFFYTVYMLVSMYFELVFVPLAKIWFENEKTRLGSEEQ
jgi:hypothetical protein